MKTLVFWGHGSLHVAKRQAREGATLLLWDERDIETLKAAGIPYQLVNRYITEEKRDAIDEVAMVWTKAWGRQPILEGRSFRELYEWKGVSLFWFAELYLHHSTRSPRYVRTIETYRQILNACGPDDVEAVGLPVAETILLSRMCTACGILFVNPPKAFRFSSRGVSLMGRWNTVKTFFTALKHPLIPPPASRENDLPQKRVLFFSHAAFWRERREMTTGETQEYEHYFDRLIPEVEKNSNLESIVVAVGPQATFRGRSMPHRLREWLRLGTATGSYVPINRYTTWRVFREVLVITRKMRRAWKDLRQSPGLHQAFSHGGVFFADLVKRDLAGVFFLQIPWAVRSYEEMVSVLHEIHPDVVCLYAESSGWGRVVIAACQAKHTPTVAIQHGILYPKYYSYRHDPDEGDCPRPTRTAVFGEAARRLLIEKGRYLPESLVLTGSSKFDELLEVAQNWDRLKIRDRLGVPKNELLVLVASRYRGIRETHQSIGSAFPGLVRAIDSLGNVHCLVKPHPAEPADPYEVCIRQIKTDHARILPSGADLMELLYAADALVTVESLSAIEALVLRRPVLILNMPTNLSELVEEGVALGVPVGEDPTAALKGLLFDPEIRRSLDAARERYLSTLVHGVDGGATRRILALIESVIGFAQ